ncbi:MAG: helix-turn-helix transcriptional regulator, partial [Verrucomicrobia bacterium]|nr:helix-turn-helix transcriptional regulator [Verrucomicrobiota bacterium]
HLNRMLNVEQVAEHVGVSKRTLETRFRESLQTSPHDFFMNLHVHHAQTWMQMPQTRTIKQTARECGFGSVPAFHRAFRRITGESPGSFRKKQSRKRRRCL